jgi:hypothetical protein
MRSQAQSCVCLKAEKQKQKALDNQGLSMFLAERGGFEPPIGYEPIHAFQACDLNHSSISPDGFRHFRGAAYYSKDSRQYKRLLCRAAWPDGRTPIL